jgi:Response regulators consisting of a CheY-like receiver domain and a winged-helix DNA-binding domain
MEITMNKNIFTVLIVEDTKEILDLIVLHLEDKYNLIKAEDGREAIKIVETEKIDLVILDIMLPLVNGYECMKVIREKRIFLLLLFQRKVRMKIRL